MSTDDDISPPRAGTYADLSRRMDRMEQKHESLEGEVRTLSATVGRVEANQLHATELNKLRFDSLDTGVKSVDTGFREFSKRIEGIISGDIQTAQTRQGATIMAEYLDFRKDTLRRLDAQEEVESKRAIAEDARSAQRAGAWNISNRALGILILVGNFALAVWVAYSNLTGPHLPTP